MAKFVIKTSDGGNEWLHEAIREVTPRNLISPWKSRR